MESKKHKVQRKELCLKGLMIKQFITEKLLKQITYKHRAYLNEIYLTLTTEVWSSYQNLSLYLLKHIKFKVAIYCYFYLATENSEALGVK